MVGGHRTLTDEAAAVRGCCRDAVVRRTANAPTSFCRPRLIWVRSVWGDGRRVRDAVGGGRPTGRRLDVVRRAAHRRRGWPAHIPGDGPDLACCSPSRRGSTASIGLPSDIAASPWPVWCCWHHTSCSPPGGNRLPGPAPTTARPSVARWPRSGRGSCSRSRRGRSHRAGARCCQGRARNCSASPTGRPGPARCRAARLPGRRSEHRRAWADRDHSRPARCAAAGER
jgi:hypothetical protein